MDPNTEPGSDQFVELVEQCIRAYTTEGPVAMEGVFASHPKMADQLRRHLQKLERLGLLGIPGDQPPDSLGPYEIRRRIGRGGMSEVFLAHDPRMGRDVAIKCAPLGMTLEGRAQQRFQREVQAVAKLSHPGIVPVYGAGEANGRAYFTMEYADGETLANVLRMLREPEGDKLGASRSQRIAAWVGADEQGSHIWQQSYVELTTRWILALAVALDHAHKAGVIHRDVNPSNVIVRCSGQVQLFDFGLARVSDAPALTHSGEFTGTPYYASPEQARGQSNEVDERCDVYSLGVTMYEILTLRRPFEGANTQEVLGRIQSAEPAPLRQHDRRIPRDLELVCLTAMERDRHRRYPDMSAFATDLRSFLTFEPIVARPPSAGARALRWLRKRPIVGGGVLALAVILAGLPPIMLRINTAVRRERDAALAVVQESQRSAELARQVEGFLVGLFEANPENAESLTIEEVIERGLDDLSYNSIVEGKTVEYALLETVGRMHSKLGQHKRAIEVFLRAIQLREEERGTDDPGLVSLHLGIGAELLSMGNFLAAHSRGQRGLDLLHGSTDASRPKRTACLLLMAEADVAQNFAQEARTHFDDAVELRRGLDDGQSIEVVSRIATLAVEFGHFSVARELYEQEIEKEVRSGESGFVRLGALRSGLVEALEGLGNHEASDRVQRTGREAERRMATWRASLEATLPELPLDFESGAWRSGFERELNAGISQFRTSDFLGSRQSFLNALEIEPKALSVAFNLACVESQLGNIDECFAWLDRALEFGLGRTSQPSILSFEDEHDLKAPRDDPRFARYIDRLHAAWIEPLVCTVDGAGGGIEARHVLVRLLPADTDLEEARQDDFAKQAVANDWMLVTLVTPNPGGLRNPDWLIRPADYAELAKEMRERVIQGIARAIPAIDFGRDMVIISGENASGPVAASLALHYSTMFRGLVLFDSYPGPERRDSALRNAALAGLRVVVADREEVAVEWTRAGVSQAELSAAVADWFKALTLDVHQVSLAEGAGGAEALEVFAQE